MNAIHTFLITVLSSFFFLACTTNEEASTDSGDSPTPYDGSWEALQQMPIPEWFDNGKIGIFIHWGPYSAIGYREDRRGYGEHVPKLLYRDTAHYYPYMRERWGQLLQSSDIKISYRSLPLRIGNPMSGLSSSQR